MSRRLFLSLGILAILCTPAYADKSQDDLKAMEGTWIPVSGELAGGVYPPDELKKIKLVIKGEAYTVTVDSKEDKGTVKLDSAKAPKQIDITGTEGPNKGKTIASIYEFVDKDTFRVCYALAGERPSEFKTAKGEVKFLVTYKREKP